MTDQQQPKFRIQDNPSIIETYANKFLGSVFDGGAVKFYIWITPGPSQKNR